MFTVLTVLICYSLLTFGAVLPNSWFAITILWSSAIGGILIHRALRQQSLRLPLIVLFLSSVLLPGLVQSRLAIGLVAGVFAWAAAGRDEGKTVRFFNVLVLIGVLEALLGLGQFFISPGWIFGYTNVSARVSGTLINRNHFAGLLEMLIPVSLGLAYSSTRRFGDLARPYLYVLAGAFMGLALVFSSSRMGIFSFLLTVCFLGVVLRIEKSQRKLAAGLMFSIFALVLAGALWIGADVVVERFADLVGEDAILQEGRVLVFRDAIRMIIANPFGVGIGSFQDIYRQYQTFRSDLLFDHAHNDYLETTAEWGLPVAAVFWAFLFYVVIRSVRIFASIESRKQRGILLACIGAIFSMLVHSLTDFNLQIPSNAMLFFSFAGISLAIPTRETRAGANILDKS